LSKYILDLGAYYLYIYWAWGLIRGQKVDQGGVNNVRGIRVSKRES